jgi:hypothetical protein
MMGDTLYSPRSPSDHPVILGYNVRVQRLPGFPEFPKNAFITLARDPLSIPCCQLSEILFHGGVDAIRGEISTRGVLFCL